MAFFADRRSGTGKQVPKPRLRLVDRQVLGWDCSMFSASFVQRNLESLHWTRESWKRSLCCHFDFNSTEFSQIAIVHKRISARIEIIGPFRRDRSNISRNRISVTFLGNKACCFICCEISFFVVTVPSERSRDGFHCSVSSITTHFIKPLKLLKAKVDFDITLSNTVDWHRYRASLLSNENEESPRRTWLNVHLDVVSNKQF